MIKTYRQQRMPTVIYSRWHYRDATKFSKPGEQASYDTKRKYFCFPFFHFCKKTPDLCLSFSHFMHFCVYVLTCTGQKNWRKSKLLIFVNFHVPGSWKLEKIEASDLCGFSCTRGHENWRKSKRLIFVDFHVPGVLKIEASDFCEFSCTRGHGNWRKLKCLIFVNFHVQGVS